MTLEFEIFLGIKVVGVRSKGAVDELINSAEYAGIESIDPGNLIFHTDKNLFVAESVFMNAINDN